MNSEQNVEEVEVHSPERKVSSVNSVTPLSKYLAMLLFISMPFIGGYVGYKLSLDKVFEVEKIESIETNVSSDSSYVVESSSETINNTELSNNPQEFSTTTLRYSVKDGVVKYAYWDGWFDKIIEDADSGSFFAICTSDSSGLSYAKDKTSVYFMGERITGADPATFLLLGQLDYKDWDGCPQYSRDTNYIYYEGVKISNSPDSFRSLDSSNYLFTDGKNIYSRYRDLDTVDENAYILSPDAKNFTVLTDLGVRLLYAKDSDYLYISSPQSNQLSKLHDSDAESFRFITAGLNSTSTYAIDKNNVYYFGDGRRFGGLYTEPIDSAGVDVSTLRPTWTASGQPSKCSLMDKDNVFIERFIKVEGAQPNSFIVTVDDCILGQDRNQIFNLLKTVIESEEQG